VKDGSSIFLRKPWCAQGGSINYFQPSAKVEAKNWFRKAAAQGHERALRMMKMLMEMGF